MPGPQRQGAGGQGGRDNRGGGRGGAEKSNHIERVVAINRVAARGSDLEFALGYSHPVPVAAPEGISFEVQSPTRFVVRGIDKQKVGEVAANIRKLRKPDPYKGKGVRYEGEQIKLKVGKTGK